MSAKHTPGPWHVGTVGDGEPGYVYCGNSLGSAVAIVYGRPLQWTVFSREEEEANARLIAAAPEMLDALKDLVKAHRVARVELGYDEDGESDSIEIAEAAIAKAEGQS